MGRQWTSKELELLKSRYLKVSNLELGLELGRSEKAIKSKLASLGLNRSVYNFYTTEDKKKILNNDYTVEELAEFYKLSISTVKNMRREWGYKKKKSVK